MIGVCGQSQLRRSASISRWSGRSCNMRDGLFHGALRGPVDVDLVDGGDVNSGNGPGQRVLANARRQLLARLAVQQLGIAQPADAIAGIEDHGRGHHWPEQRSPADLIDARDQPGSRGPRHFSYFSVHFSRFSRRSLSVALETALPQRLRTRSSLAADFTRCRTDAALLRF